MILGSIGISSRAARHGAHLDHAGGLEYVHQQECVGHRGCDGQQAVVAQHQETLVAEVGDEPRFLLGVQRHALVGVVAERRQHEDRLLRDRQYALLLGGHRHAIDAVDVQHAPGIFARRMDRAVDREARRIDLVRAVHDLAAVEVDLDQARCRDLVERHAVRIDQEVVLRPGHPRRDVREDQIVPAIEGHQPVARGEIDPLLPLLRTDLRAYCLGCCIAVFSPCVRYRISPSRRSRFAIDSATDARAESRDSRFLAVVSTV